MKYKVEIWNDKKQSWGSKAFPNLLLAKIHAKELSRQGFETRITQRTIKEKELLASRINFILFLSQKEIPVTNLRQTPRSLLRKLWHELQSAVPEMCEKYKTINLPWNSLIYWED